MLRTLHIGEINIKWDKYAGEALQAMVKKLGRRKDIITALGVIDLDSKNKIIKTYYSMKYSQYAIKFIKWGSELDGNEGENGFGEIYFGKKQISKLRNEIFLNNQVSKTISTVLKAKRKKVEKENSDATKRNISFLSIFMNVLTPPHFEYLPDHIELIQMFSKAMSQNKS